MCSTRQYVGTHDLNCYRENVYVNLKGSECASESQHGRSALRVKGRQYNDYRLFETRAMKRRSPALAMLACWRSPSQQRQGLALRQRCITMSGALPEPPAAWAEQAWGDYYHESKSRSSSSSSSGSGGSGISYVSETRTKSFSRRDSLMDDVRTELSELSDRGRDLLFEYSEKLLIRKALNASRTTTSICAAVGCGACGTVVAWLVLSSLAPLGGACGAALGATLALADSRTTTRRSNAAKLLLVWTRACAACVLAGWVRLRKLLGNASSDIKSRAENFDYPQLSLADWWHDLDDKYKVSDKVRLVYLNITQLFDNTFKTRPRQSSVPAVAANTYHGKTSQPVVISSSKFAATPKQRPTTPQTPRRKTAGQQRASQLARLRHLALLGPKRALSASKSVAARFATDRSPSADVVVVSQPNYLVSAILPAVVFILYDRSDQIAASFDLASKTVTHALASGQEFAFCF